jgi:hypothetical protein
MTEADRVNSPEMTRYARTTWFGVVAAVLPVPVDAIRLMLGGRQHRTTRREIRQLGAAIGLAAAC